MYFIVVFTVKYNTYTGDSIQQQCRYKASILINKVSDDACQ